MSGAEGDAALLARRRDVLGPAYRLFYDEPFHPVRGEGVRLFDGQGHAFLDAYNNVPSVGHCHPRVVAAVQQQTALLNTHTRYLHGTILDCAERLVASMAPPLAQVMFTCTGSEANDLALRLARGFTGAKGIIITTDAYHGVTQSCTELSPSLWRGAVGETVRCVPPPAGGQGDEAVVGRRFAVAVQAAIDDLAEHGLGTAALLVDTVFSSDGIYTDPAGCLAPAITAVRQAGGLFIADEVQAGLGRTGRLWGFQRHAVVPDIVTLGKPLGNGYPVAGVVARRDVLERFASISRYFNTFGGNPVACAAALAVQEVIADEGLVEHSRRMGEYLRLRLRELATSSGRLGEVRGAGLLAGVDVIDAQGRADGAAARRLVEAMRARRVLISSTGPTANVLKIRPPLVFQAEHVDELCTTLAACLA